MDIYIGNINYQVGENDIRKLFEIFGKVLKVTLVRDKADQKSLGYGFINMPDSTEAIRAMDELDGRIFAGRKLIAKKSVEKKSQDILQYSNDEEPIADENHFQKNTPKGVYSSTNTEDGYVKIKFNR